MIFFFIEPITTYIVFIYLLSSMKQEFNLL